GRYILTSSHLTGKRATHTAALGVFEAPQPWGPWSTVYYNDHWSVKDGKDCRTYHHRFPPKWMSPDGKTMWLLYSGLDCDLYSFCVKKAVLEIAEPIGLSSSTCVSPRTPRSTRGIQKKGSTQPWGAQQNASQ
ncbi:MAG: hypothetical protein ACYSUD_17450, partial [Planctomycetota bacterium]